MALSETDNSDCNSDSSVDGSKQGERKEKLFTKVVVRRLPPSMNKDSFVNQVSPLPDFDYMYFVRADISLGEFAFARAYINFKNPNDIFIFKEKFDNYVFLDSKGNEFAAVVEFAPFSRIPKKRNKVRNDPKSGTIETDPIYTEFVESLNQVSTENEEKPEYCFQPSLEEDKKVVNTPLLDFIKQRRIDRQKMKEEKREERKRRELERKKIKDEERKGRKRIEHVTVSKISTHTKSANLDAIDENKLESSPKTKDKKVEEYRGKPGKPGAKEYSDKRPSYSSNKDIHRTTERKSPSKIRQRNQNVIEKEPRKTEYKHKREDNSSRPKKDEKEEKVVEKKVKKYSERREERKNEFKKQEQKTESSGSLPVEPEKEIKPKNCEPKHKLEEKENKKELERSNSDEKNRERDDDKNGSEKSYDGSGRDRENDPRSQRRIRNKDRPTMAIYQPGMGFARQRKPNSAEPADEGQKTSTSSDTTTKSQ